MTRTREWAAETTYYTDQGQALHDMAETMHRAARVGVGSDYGVRTMRTVQDAVEALESQILDAIAATGCQSPTGGCPTHGQGDLVVSPDGATECDPCGRVWMYDRTTRPCGYPATVDRRCPAHQQ